MLLIRRRFLKTTGTCILAKTTDRHASALAAKFESPPHPTRRIYPLNENWLYSPTVPANGHVRSFDDRAFEQVHLPHSNVFVPWHNNDQASYQFVSLYRRHFTIPPEAPNRCTFVDFDAVMTASKVYLNGNLLGEYFGDYTPFSFELTQHLDPEGENLLSVEVDSRELPEVPPFGYEIDYLTYGGIYRGVSIRTVNAILTESLRVTCHDVLTSRPRIEIAVLLNSVEKKKPDTLETELFNAAGTVFKYRQRLTCPEQDANTASINLSPIDGLKLRQLHDPAMYSVRVRLFESGQAIDEQITRFGLREARFTPQGFSHNGQVLRLGGLSRHLTFPSAGSAMPARVQRRDVSLLKQLKCNIVRCSHYPPSTHFLDACDELGLLVIDETPGLQHVGGSELWRERYLDNTRRMICRDYNHPSIILWSIRINEFRDFHDLYVKVNALARGLDPSRQTTGVRYFHQEHIFRYARIFNQLASLPGYSGGLGWCGFDYQTHSDFGSGDHICYHGVMDIFREPKPAAAFFRSQCPPSDEAVLESGFHFAMNDEPGGFKQGIISSNCDQIRAYIGRDDVWHHIIDLTPERKQFPFLAYPPEGNEDWGDLRLDGYVEGKLAITKSLFGKGTDQAFEALADDAEFTADGSDGHPRPSPHHRSVRISASPLIRADNSSARRVSRPRRRTHRRSRRRTYRRLDTFHQPTRRGYTHGHTPSLWRKDLDLHDEPAPDSIQI
ncbi:MAG TPA: glycoside hydrolase family 2 TIM barrel-domain containing protein [Edaphobacter sp.]|nr:glycoside hydrolase family 2 TIM barrel-domain containing protein [Edaphobacter sp.]